MLDNVAKNLRIDKRSVAAKPAASGATTLEGLLTATELIVDELYRSGRTFTELGLIAALDIPALGPNEAQVARGIGRLTHVDDTTRLATWRTWLSGGSAPSDQLGTIRLTTLFGRGAPKRAHSSPSLLWLATSFSCSAACRTA